MRTTLTLTLASFKMMLRNKQSLFFALFMPIVIMTIFGFIGFDSVPKIELGIVTSQPTPATQQFIAAVKDVSAFAVHESTVVADERAALIAGDRAVVLVIPDALLPDLAATELHQLQTLSILTSTAAPQQAQTAMSILTQMLDATTLQIAQAPQLFTLQTESVSAKNARYIDFLLPGIVAMAVMQMSIFSVAFVFADYKEKGILKRLVATPMQPYQFVAANVIVRLTMALLQTAILIALGVFLLDSQVLGSYWLIGLISLLGGVMFLGLGFTVSGIAKTVDAVPAIANIVAFPMLFLSGVFFPASSMPGWLQSVVQFLPLTYFANAMRDVMADGASFQAITPDLLGMLIWSVLLIILSNLTFTFEEKRV